MSLPRKFQSIFKTFCFASINESPYHFLRFLCGRIYMYFVPEPERGNLRGKIFYAYNFIIIVVSFRIAVLHISQEK